MFHFLAQIFAKIGFVGLVLLSNLGLAHIPTEPAQRPPTIAPIVSNQAVALPAAAKPKTATSASKSELVTTPVAPAAQPKTFTTPSGAVVDANGNLLKVPGSAVPLVKLPDIILIKLTPSYQSATIEWSVSQIGSSRVFLYEPKTDGAVIKIVSPSQAITSEGRDSIYYKATIADLDFDTPYKFTIEATAGLQSTQTAVAYFTTLPQTLDIISNIPHNPADNVPFFKISSNGTPMVKKLVFTHDDSYCVGGYLGYVVTSLNLQYGSAGIDAAKDSNGRFVIDFPGLGIGAKDLVFRISPGWSNGQSAACLNPGVKFTLLGSESVINDEMGKKLHFSDVILTATLQ